jgi:hypothetical protein
VFRASPPFAGGSSTPGDALPYEYDRKLPHVMCLSSSGAFYKHCGNPGQGNCGQNPAKPLPAFFKRAFEIDIARKNTFVKTV